MNSEDRAYTQLAKKKVEVDPRRPVIVIWGAAFSLAFLGFFFFLQSRTGPLAEIPEAFLWFSLVPIIIGFVLGGYVRTIKLGEAELGMSEALPRGLSPFEGQPPPGQMSVQPELKPAVQKALEESSGVSVAQEPKDLPSTYTFEYEKRTEHYMLAHVCRPLKPPPEFINYKWFDIFIFVVRHQRLTPGPPATKLDEIKSAEFYLGPSWRGGPTRVENTGRLIGINTNAWGTFLCSCRLTFKDNRKPVDLFRFIDFYMDPGYRAEALPEVKS